MGIKSVNAHLHMAPDVSVADVVDCVASTLPDVEARFKQLGHREIRVSLFVESMDPLAKPVTTDTPVVMIPLYVKRI